MARRSARQAGHDPGSRERPRVAALPVQERRATGVDCARTVLITAVAGQDRQRFAESCTTGKAEEAVHSQRGGWRVCPPEAPLGR